MFSDIVTRVDTTELFTIWVQGQSPNAKRDSHAVVIVPAVSYSDFPSRRDAALENVEFISNSKEIQAVYHKKLDILSATFYMAGTLETDQLSLTVDVPCITMVAFSSSGITLHVSDPTHSETKVTFAVRGTFTCETCSSQNSQTSVTVNFPSGDIQGSTVSIILEK